MDIRVAPRQLPLYAEWWRSHAGRKRRRRRNIPLSVAVTSAVIIGAALIWLGFAVFEQVVGIDNTKPANRADVLKTALTAVAGVGGAVALVVAYRRQQDLEEGRFVERFGAAAAQLGNPDPAVRIAGVYAMAGVADERKTTFLRRQQCIDVLCGYLRLPYDPAQGDSHVTELVTTTRPSGGAAGSEEARHQIIRQNDREVRQTIVSVIAAHLRKSAEVNWSLHDFDFTTALFEDANFEETVFSGEKTAFGGARFTGFTSFDHALFNGGYAFFKNAKFSGDKTMVSFDDTKFSAKFTSFAGAKFNCFNASFKRIMCAGDKSVITFERAEFATEHTTFDGAKFSGSSTTFEKATFAAKLTSFCNAQFSSVITEFGDATFCGQQTSSETTLLNAPKTLFEKSIFSGETVSFVRTKFSGSTTSFTGAEFRSAATKFDAAQFTAATTSFNEAKFTGKAATFDWARFDSAIMSMFDEAQFSAQLTSFEAATFSDSTSFNRVEFSGETATFKATKFNKGLISFVRARFGASNTEFIGTEFRGTTVFSEATFDGLAATATFDKTIFGGDDDGHTTFCGTTFRNKSTVFARPLRWKVYSDWDHSRDEMPACISPRTWPPQLFDES
ncbi:pentapeptide repeat-containing protein [Mycobacterium sp. 852002-51163_SCH5372311]|uniref:pentapeptide repeat-containing protein n=1 Tax=Mycobacterium sp. 852002-51163_SCH5372311 TaxID=1834097 RepID=UPI0012E86CBC|nr:hypothetical protein [Mycobacterium sp. 852002-51163_SCH5372311]